MKRLILLLLFTASAWAQPLEVQTGQNAGSTLRPLTTLGVEAESDHERQRFAELLVRQEYRRLE
ncbi:TIGR03759 family integrating conjugative element protein, partial [Salmonella enterica subsp. enterica serovar Virchow]|nr:TIGR03759 family integrating conjugative element protein [Salmonella enterica subsp. enterica serovar Virchow]